MSGFDDAVGTRRVGEIRRRRSAGRRLGGAGRGEARRRLSRERMAAEVQTGIRRDLRALCVKDVVARIYIQRPTHCASTWRRMETRVCLPVAKPP